MGAGGQKQRTWGRAGLYPAMAGEMKEEKEMRWERKTEWQSRAEDGVAMETEEGGMEGEEDWMEKAEDSAEEGPDRRLDEEKGEP